jgi:hypothetical protein
VLVLVLVLVLARVKTSEHKLCIVAGPPTRHETSRTARYTLDIMHWHAKENPSARVVACH